MVYKQKLVVIGNGMAGARFVEEVLARQGSDMFEIVVFGEEPYGNYNRILLSSVLCGLHNQEDIFINSLNWYKKNLVKLHAGVRVIKIDRSLKKVYGTNGIRENYHRLIIATGSSPLLPPMEGLFSDYGGFKEGVFVLRTLDDCNRIIDYAVKARRAAVIGGGLLGLEAARGLSGMGLETHVIHLMPHLMEVQLDPLAGAVLKQTLEQLGLHIHLEKSTTKIMGNGRVTGLEFKDGSCLECDIVVISAGIRPNVELAREAGLVVERGIVVGDDLCCLGNPDIAAIGECAQHRGQVYGLVAPVWEQARILAEIITGYNPQAIYQGSKLATKLKVMGIELAVMGDKEPKSDDEVITHLQPAHGIYRKLIVREGKLAGAILVGDGLTSPRLLQTFDRAASLPQNRAEFLFPIKAEPHTTDVVELDSTVCICNCNNVSKATIIEAVKAGCNNLAAVCNATRAGTGCGSCRDDIRTILEMVNHLPITLPVPNGTST
ncbi:MAG: FAD-dependent oxidoreductase, partial [Acidobacteriota bacterium]